MKALLPILALLTTVSILPAASLPEAQKIDALLAKSWQKQNLTPNPPATDSVMVRRLYLDIAGRIPTAEETQEFMKSQDPMKRMKLIDRLLGSDGYTSNMFNYWADILRLTDNVKGRVTAQAYEEWLKQQLKANKPYDQFVRDLLTTDGGIWDSGSIGFYQRDENKLDHLAYTVQVFLGTQIVCAQCHNHPFDKWSQMDYYGMAAFTYGMDTRGGGLDLKSMSKNAGKPQVDREALKNMTPKERKAYMADQRKGGNAMPAGVSREEMQEVRKTLQDVMKPLRYTSIQWNDNKLPKLPNDYKYPDAKPGAEVGPKVLFGHEVTTNGVQTRLQAFADWMTSPDNPRFTTVIANRMWKKAFGIGLIEPVDEMMDSTVPSNNELMEYLNELMVEKKYSLKSFLRVLYNTEAYQRMSTREEVPLGETYHFTGPTLRRMSAEQIWDSFVTLSRGNVDTGTGEKDEKMHQYLGDLKYLIDTVKEKGAEGLVEVAKKGAADREATNAKLESLRKEMEAAQASGNASTAGQLAREANRLRRENSNDMLEAIVGEDRADDLRRGYSPDKKKGGKNAVPAGLTREQLATMSKEQRRDAIKMGNSLNLTARASEIASPARPGHLLRTFGQSDREQIQNASDDATVPQALALLNGPTSEVLNSPVSKLRQDVDKATTPQAKMDAIYLSCLSRLPSSNERAMLNDVIHERGDRAYGDVIQALLTGSQFVFVQ